MSRGSDTTALLRVGQMQEADRLTEAAGTSGRDLMQSAGAAVARETMARWSARPVAVLCGPGNNGGDGFVAASVLASAGWPVRVGLTGPVEALRGDAAFHAARWKGPVEPLDSRVLEGAGLVVDAIFGAGLSRPLEAGVASVLHTVRERGMAVVAVDVPSGMMGDTGESLGAVQAALTVTFTRKKPGHLLLPGRDLCGTLVVADIGTPASVLEHIEVDTWENDPDRWRDRLPQLEASGNKYSRGHALLAGGYPTTGAARMAARAAARVGAGLTTIAVPERALDVYASALTSIMVRPLAVASDLHRLLEDRRFSACLIGPGSGRRPETREHALAMLGSGRPVVLDADAITVFAQDPRALFAAIRGPCVLTPHEGEFARLFDASADEADPRAARLPRKRCVDRAQRRRHGDRRPRRQGHHQRQCAPHPRDRRVGRRAGGHDLGVVGAGNGGFRRRRGGGLDAWRRGPGTSGRVFWAEDLPDLLPGVLRRLA